MGNDTQFSLLYALKGFRLIILFAALSLATTVFINRYNQTVLFDKKPPPPLTGLVTLFILIDFVFNAVLWLILWLIKQNWGNDFVLFDTFFTKLLIDYVMTTGLVFVIGFLIAIILLKKLRLNPNGIDGDQEIVAFKQMLLAISGFVILIPFMLIV